MAIEEDNREAFTAYLEGLDQHIKAYSGTNPFWSEIYQEFRALIASGGSKDLVAAVNSAPKTNYLVRPVSPESFDATWDDLIGHLDLLNQSGRAAEIPPPSYEGVLVAWYLQKIGRLEEARRMLREARLTPTYVNLRHTYYATQIMKSLASSHVDALEVGAGGSSLKLLLGVLLGGRLRSYTIVDLPEMLCMSISAALSFRPLQRISIATKERSLKQEPHVFVPAGLVDQVYNSPVAYNLFVNTHSFQEMDDGIISGYFDLFYRKAGDGALFFNTNWRQSKMTRLDGSAYDNDPRLYPYREIDEVIYEGTDPLHETLRKHFGLKSKTENRTSIRRIQREDTESAAPAVAPEGT